MTGGGADGPARLVTLAQALDAAMDATFVVEGDGTISYVNPVVEHVLGWKPDELVGSNLASLIHRDDLEPIALAVARAELEAAHARSTTHVRLRQRDGGYAHFSLSGNGIEGDDLRFFTVFRRADDLEVVFDLLTRLSESGALGEVLAGLPRFIQWRHDAPHTAIVWDDGERRHAAGDPIAGALCGLDVTASADSPWARAWHGHECLGVTAELADDLRARAEGENLAAFWVRPVHGIDGRVEALLTMWDPPRDRPLAAYRLIFDYLTRATEVAVLWDGQRRELVHHAQYDSLTGVANRRIFYEELGRSLHPAERALTDALVYIDLDGFKPVNDSHGHAAGDVVLAEVAARLRDAADKSDLAARLGG